MPPSKSEADQPAIYEIRIGGELGSQWAGWFDEMAIRVEQSGETLLVGAVADQAALFGLPITAGPRLYYVVLFLVVCAFLFALNVLRAPLGQAMMAIFLNFFIFQAGACIFPRWKSSFRYTKLVF